MKKIFTTSIALITTALLFGQVPLNEGFENWTNAGIFEDPDNWGTVNFASAFVQGFPVTCEKTTDAHSGQYAVKLTTQPANTDLAPYGFDYDTVPGILLIGNIGSQEIGMSYTQRPTSAQFYYKYHPEGADSAGAIVQLTRWVQGQGQEVVGQGYIIFNSEVSTYTLGTIPVQYFSDSIPDTLTFVTFSSAAAISLFGGNNFPETGPPIPGSLLYFDDFSLNVPILPNALNDEVAGEFTFNMYPNPAHNELLIMCNGHQFANYPLTVEFYDMTGRKVEQVLITQLLQKADITSLSSGMYIYAVKNGANILRSGKLIVTK